MAFGFLAFDGVEELDLVGPWEMIATWSRHLAGPSPCLVVAATRAPITAANGMVIAPHADYESAPTLDYLLVPGGMGTRREVDSAATLDYLRRAAPGCKALLSVCTGSFLLQRAGLADGEALTTHWGSLGRLRETGHARVVEQRWVRSGQIWSSAGVSAGIDMALAFIAATAGGTRPPTAFSSAPSTTRKAGATASQAIKRPRICADPFVAEGCGRVRWTAAA